MNLVTQSSVARRARSKAVDMDKFAKRWRELVAEGHAISKIAETFNAEFKTNYTAASLTAKVDNLRKQMEAALTAKYKREIEHWIGMGEQGKKHLADFQAGAEKFIDESVPRPARSSKAKAFIADVLGGFNFDIPEETETELNEETETAGE